VDRGLLTESKTQGTGRLGKGEKGVWVIFWFEVLSTDPDSEVPN
jgi:hypothetical protein